MPGQSTLGFCSEERNKREIGQRGKSQVTKLLYQNNFAIRRNEAIVNEPLKNKTKRDVRKSSPSARRDTRQATVKDIVRPFLICTKNHANFRCHSLFFNTFSTLFCALPLHNRGLVHAHLTCER